MKIRKILSVMVLAGFIFGAFPGLAQQSASAAEAPRRPDPAARQAKNVRTAAHGCTLEAPERAQWIVKFKEAAAVRLLPVDEGGLPQGESALARSAAAQRLSEAAGRKVSFGRLVSGGAFVFLASALQAGEAQVQSTEACLTTEQALAVADTWMKLEEVEYAHPDWTMTLALTPNDPSFSQQWHYLAPAGNNFGINAPAAWEITTGASSVVVAVVDTGITQHADLRERLLPGYDMITDAWTANDGGGRDADASDPGDWVLPYDCGDPQGDNSSWHGTHVAGTIGASSNNGTGVAGVNWAAPLLPVRVLGRCGGVESDLVDGIRWAAGLAVPGVPANPYPAKVINMSLTRTAACSPTLQTAITAARSAGAVVVAAAGNNADDAAGYSPSNCTGVISVAATKKNGDLALSYSNDGSTIELSAPGGDILLDGESGGVLSTLNSGTTVPAAGTYGFYDGTSMAAPHVAGVASLLFSVNPSLTPSQVQQIMQGTATDFPLFSYCSVTGGCGAGIVNAGAAVSILPRLTSLSPSSADAGSGSLVLTVNGANFAVGAAIYWDSTLLATTYANSTRLTATLPSGLLAAPGVHLVKVVTPTAYGEMTTRTLAFAVGLDTRAYLPLLLRGK